MSGVGLPSASGCKDPEYVYKKRPASGGLFYLFGKKFWGFFRRKNQNLGGLLRPPLGAECQNGIKTDFRLRVTRVQPHIPSDEKSSEGSQKTAFIEHRKHKKYKKS